jgi:hypothetical protein
MLFGLGWFFKSLSGLIQKATVLRRFLIILPNREIYSKTNVSVFLSFEFMGMKKLKNVPAQ